MQVYINAFLIPLHMVFSILWFSSLLIIFHIGIALSKDYNHKIIFINHILVNLKYFVISVATMSGIFGLIVLHIERINILNDVFLFLGIITGSTSYILTLYIFLRKYSTELTKNGFKKLLRLLMVVSTLLLLTLIFMLL